MDPEERLRWMAVDDLEKFPSKGEMVRMETDDVIETARKQSRLTVIKARRVAGMPLGSLATVIIRTPERSINAVYFQVIPAGCEQQHLGVNSYASLL